MTSALAFAFNGFVGLFVWVALASLVKSGSGTGARTPAGPFFYVPVAFYQVIGIAGAFLTSLAIKISGLLLRRKMAGKSPTTPEDALLVRALPVTALAGALDIRLKLDPDEADEDAHYLGPEKGRRAITLMDIGAAELLGWFVIVLTLIDVSLLMELVSQ